ncbi:MAG: PTS glucose transporter subunit IIBC [Synergistaceae bacterium]|jgi:PTS system glucose-specific IIC component|nr:PTS glucose transporter subunit IIBC [Synergistaceae bacterium]
MNPLNNAAGFFQQIGKSLMLPVAILPVAGILLGVGSSQLSWIPETISHLMASGGSVIFGNLALIFAVGVALGFTDNDGTSALSAVIGYLVMTATLGIMAIEVLGMNAAPEARELQNVLGMTTIDTGVFGGIIIGGLSAAMFNRFYHIELPPYLAFFSGKRFVPIVTGIVAIITGVVLSYVWPPVQARIMIFSNWAAYSNPVMAGTIYGFIERLFLPFGLHHAWNVPFFFEIGSFTDPVTGTVIHGDINRFFAGDPTAGILSGGFLTKMWGLPMAAIAIWQTAKPENRAKVGGIMMSAALTSFLTGITEPIEFSFMFVAPMLYGIHAVLTGAAFATMNLLGAHLGYTFSQGAIDFLLYYRLDTKPWLVFVIGPVYAVLYFVIFRTFILTFGLRTPGREDEAPEERVLAAGGGKSGLSRQIVLALGGRGNIAALDNCITRLRAEVHAPEKVDSRTLKSLGAAGVVVRGKAVQVIFGTIAGNIKSDIDDYLKTAGSDAERPDETPQPAQPSADQEGPDAFAGDITEATAEEMERLASVLGGMGNIESAVPGASTRLIVLLRDKNLLDRKEAEKSGFGILTPSRGDAIQVIVGPHPERFRIPKA